jgi:oligopeptide transport system permease protein
LLRFFPGSPFLSEEQMNPELQLQLEVYYGLHENYFVQLGNYFHNLMQGKLGYSMHYLGRSVESLIFEFAMTSLKLGFMAFFIAVLFSMTYAILTRAFRFREALDPWLLFFYSVPLIVLGPFLIWIFAFQLELVPVAFLEQISSYFLPILILTIKPSLSLSRILSESLDKALEEPYITTAKAQGASDLRVLGLWALKNAWTPYLVQLATVFTSLISGSFLVEMLFAIPGLGRQFIESVMNRDYPLIMGLTIFYGALVLISHFLIDLLTQWIDPRVKT